jgi:hypothetical protein
MYKNSFHTSQRILCFHNKTNRLVLYRVTSAVCRYENHTEQINAVGGQSALYLMFNPAVYMLTTRL